MKLKHLCYAFFLFAMLILLIGCRAETTPSTTAVPTLVPTTILLTTAPTLVPTIVPTAIPTAAPTAVPPTEMAPPANCLLTARTDVTVYQRASAAANQFGVLAAGEVVQVTMRTDTGWLGFDPATAQAANVGVFRLRWIAPDADVAREGGCSDLPVAASVSPTACYFMAMMDTAVYTAPDASSTVLTTIPRGGYTAVTGQTTAGWYQLDLQDGSLAQAGSGWLNPIDGNFNGTCDSLPDVTP